MQQIQTFNQLERSTGYTRQEAQEKVLAGKLYCRRIGRCQFYAPSQSAFIRMWSEALDFSFAELNARVIEPTPRLAAFVTYYAKQKKKWNLDRNLATVLVQSLPEQKGAGCFLSISESGYGYMCLFAEKWKSLVSEALAGAAKHMEQFGALRSQDLVRLCKAYKVPSSEWTGYLLKHLAYCGWGDLVDGEVLENPLFKNK